MGLVKHACYFESTQSKGFHWSKGKFLPFAGTVPFFAYVSPHFLSVASGSFWAFKNLFLFILIFIFSIYYKYIPDFQTFQYDHWFEVNSLSASLVHVILCWLGLNYLVHINAFIKSFYYISTTVQVTRVQSQVELYQRLKKWYLMLLCLTLSISK